MNSWIKPSKFDPGIEGSKLPINPLLCRLVDAGLSWQKHRSWCDTGAAQLPRRKGGQTVMVTVTDPDPEAKKTDRAGPPRGKPVGIGGLVRE